MFYLLIYFVKINLHANSLQQCDLQFDLGSGSFLQFLIITPPPQKKKSKKNPVKNQQQTKQ